MVCRTEVAEVLSRLWDDDTLIVVSSDLSHFLRYEDAQRRDSATADAIEHLDETAIDFEDACGAISCSRTGPQNRPGKK
jgi:MEMO1 family protein